MTNWVYITRLSFSLSVVASVLLVPTCYTMAEYISPDKVVVSTENYLPQVKDLPVGEHVYDISWQGIPVATATINVQRRSDYYIVNSSVQTAKVINLLYRLKHYSSSIFSATTMKPHLFKFDQKENSREKLREVDFLDDGTVKARLRTKGKPEENLEFQPNNHVYDPYSGAFLARSINIEPGSTASFDVFNGKHRFLIKFAANKRVSLKINSVEYKALEVAPSVVRLTDTEPEDRLKEAKIWISDDSSRQILKIESKVWIGSVTAELEKFPGMKSKGKV